LKLSNAPKNEIFDCGRCGLCLNTCPVYQIVKDETLSPRGKVQLARFIDEGNITPSKEFSDVFSQCLMCGTCTANCPSGVRHDTLFVKMRSQLSDQFGYGWLLRLAYQVFTDKEKMEFAANIAKYGRNVVLKKFSKDLASGRFNLHRLPEFNKKPFRKQLPEENRPAGESRGTILYFTGCATNYMFDNIGKSVIRILTKMGFTVIIPNDQTCCALPVFINGEVDKALSNILQNIAVFNKEDIVAIVTDCATCHSALCKGYPDLLKSMGYPNQDALSLAKKVSDINEFLFDHFDLLSPCLVKKIPVRKVTFHNPCHLRNAQTVSNKVEKLLSHIPCCRFIPSQDANVCCGGGGSFAYKHMDIAKQIVSKKKKNARATGAEYWATACPGCTINLSMSLSREDGLKVVHPVELINDLI